MSDKPLQKDQQLPFAAKSVYRVGKQCPECGCEEFRGDVMAAPGCRICSECGQEWWPDVDYSIPADTTNWVHKDELERVQKQAAETRYLLRQVFYARCPLGTKFCDELESWNLGDLEQRIVAILSDHPYLSEDYIAKGDVKPLVEAMDRIYRNALIADGVNIQHVDTIWLRQTCAKALQHAQAKGLL